MAGQHPRAEGPLLQPPAHVELALQQARRPRKLRHRQLLQLMLMTLHQQRQSQVQKLPKRGHPRQREAIQMLQQQ